MNPWVKAWRQKNPGFKPCHRCMKALPLDGKSRCPECLVAAREAHRKWYYSNPEQSAAKYKRWHQKLRDDVIDAYGAKCNHCGEANRLVIQLDHVNNDGYKERKEIKGTLAVYRKVRRLGYPKDRYQLLCANCNWSKGIWGVYPDGTVP